MNTILKYLILAASFLVISQMTGQVTNDECQFAKFIQDVDEYCSKPGEFSNVGATPSLNTRPSCWPQNTEDSDVWFSFVPKNLGVFIQVTGRGLENLGTLAQPSVAVYTGNCNGLTEVACGSILFNVNIIELTLTDLTIGATYFIRVDARAKEVGNFRLCINTFKPVKAPESDCNKAVVLCDKESIFVEKLTGVGQVTNEIEDGNCLRPRPGDIGEDASVWYKWTCKDAGNLTFDITPNAKFDDIDFSLYELPGGLDDCANKKLLRCMASGETVGGNTSLNSPCFGKTGLNTTANDTEEEAGCQSGDDNYVKDIVMVPGKSYVLIINNFSESGLGFKIEFGGTGTFLGPEVDFETKALERFECDKEVIFTNKSKSLTDSITNYKWSFGLDADPAVSPLFGPLDVIYSSFGNKTVGLTVETKRGCTVTKILDFFINPCCKDTTTLAVSGLAKDLPCADSNSGIIDAIGRNGSPQYNYSLDSVNYQPIPRFSGLSAGEYTLYIRDKKGCVNKTVLFIKAPPIVIADAGEDIVVNLGDGSFLNGSYSGGTGVVDPLWSPSDSIEFVDQFSTPFLPLTDKQYTLTVTDENGCTDTDIVNIRVNKVRNVYWPNIIKSGLETANGIFRLEGGKSISKATYLRVYDRWGNKMYEGRDLDIKNLDEGWNGDFNGKDVVPGVYVWIAAVLFIDGEEIIYKGDVTVVE